MSASFKFQKMNPVPKLLEGAYVFREVSRLFLFA